MNKSKINLLLIICVEIILSTACFFLIYTKPYTEFFYVSLVMTLLLEIIGTMSVYVVSKKHNFNTQNIARAKIVLNYVEIVAVCMVLYSTLHIYMHYRYCYDNWYYAALLIITLVFFLRFMLIDYGAKIQKDTAAISVARANIQKETMKDCHVLECGLKQISINPSIETKDKIIIKRAVTSAIDTLKTVPIDKYCNDEEISSDIKLLCGELSSKLKNSENHRSSEILELANAIISICSTIKKS